MQYLPDDFGGCELRVSNFPWGDVSCGMIYSPYLRGSCRPFHDVRRVCDNNEALDLCPGDLLDAD